MQNTKREIEKFIEALQREKLSAGKIGGNLTDYIDLQDLLRFTDEYTEKINTSPWTTDRPKVAGYYWLRRYKFKDERFVEVSRMVFCQQNHFSKQIDSVYFSGNDGWWDIEELETGEWCGPIEQPVQ